MQKPVCEDCCHYDYDEENDCYFCRMEVDEDEMFRLLSSTRHVCPFFRMGDDYSTARRQ
jgi:hypothetical protein